MYLFTIKARPNPENTEIDEEIGGAYINVWVNFPEKDAAEVVAKFYIAEAGWIPDLTTETHWVTEDSYKNDEENKQFYLEAKKDGSSLVFNLWPKNADDSDVEYDIN